jgi:hypothetical protein
MTTTSTLLTPDGTVQVPDPVNVSITLFPVTVTDWVANDTPPEPLACKICPLVADPEEMATVPTDPALIFAATTALSARAAEPTAPESIFAATIALSAIPTDVRACATQPDEVLL